MAKAADQKTLDLIKEVKKRKAEIVDIGRANYRTNCSFSYTQKNNDALNVQVLGVRDILQIASFLKTILSNYNQIATDFGVEGPDFQWCGFSYSAWMEDFKLRIDRIQISDKKKKLEALEDRLGKIISPELRAEMELEAIANELK